MSENTPRADRLVGWMDGSRDYQRKTVEGVRQLEIELNEAKSQATDFLKSWVETNAKLGESQAREAMYRGALEKINADPGASNDDCVYLSAIISGEALSQPAPPVVPLADVKPLLDELQEVLYNVAAPPPNCSCHLSAPCGDCVDHAFTRELLAHIKGTIETFTAKYPQP